MFIEDRGIAQRIIAELHAMGVGCALDDFGVGYSSLAYLRKFAIDKVKLDRTFIGGIPADHEAVAIVRAVGAMARSLGIMLLAEGVEHQEQVAFLRLLGFSEGQGYLFGKAMREPALVALLNQPRMPRRSRPGRGAEGCLTALTRRRRARRACAHAGRGSSFPEPDRLRRHLDQLVLLDVGERRLERQAARRGEQARPPPCRRRGRWRAACP